MQIYLIRPEYNLLDLKADFLAQWNRNHQPLLKSSISAHRQWKVFNYRIPTLEEFHDSTVRTKRQSLEIYKQGLPDLVSGYDSVYSARAVRLLSSWFSPFGEFLEVTVQGESNTYFVYHCMNLSSALILNSSKIRYFSDGTVSTILKYSFNESEIQEPSVFRLSVMPDYTTIFVTSEIVNAVKKAGLMGFYFEEVWRSETGLKAREVIAGRKSLGRRNKLEGRPKQTRAASKNSIQPKKKSIHKSTRKK